MSEYRAYRGYYIGFGPNDFHTEAAVDAFILDRLKAKYRNAIKRFAAAASMELSIYASRIADQLAAEGLSWSEIEEIELSAY